MKALRFTSLFILLLLPQFLCAQVNPKAADSVEAPAQEPQREALSKKKVVAGELKAKLLFTEYENRRQSNFTPNSKQIPQSEQQVLDSLVQEMQQTAAETFEYHYAAYINSNRSTSQFHHLEKAHKLNPNKTELYSDFIAHYEVTDQPVKKQEFIKKWYSSGTISKAIYDYNYNVLNSVEANAILFTNGTMDTYPLWILQEMEKVRPDVMVLNFDLLQNADYQKQILQTLSIKTTGTEASFAEFLRQILQDPTGRPVYFGLTVPPILLDSLKQNLYVTGLTFKYSTQKFNNLEVLKENWEKFRGIKNLDYALIKKYRPAQLQHANQAYTRQDIDITSKRDLNSNYIVPALLLCRYYHQIDEPEKAGQLENIARKMAGTEAEQKSVDAFMGKIKRK